MRNLLSLAFVLVGSAPLGAGEARTLPAVETAPQRGYRLLTTRPYLPPDFDQQVFDELWKEWEEPARSQAAAATPQERRKLAFSRYGLDESPQHPGGVALQYVDDGKGGWVMNCLACHGGRVAGRVIPGLPNSRYDLQTLTEDVRATKLRLRKPLSHMDLGSLGMPLSGSIGTTNAVMFGKLLLAFRDPDLTYRRDRLPPEMVHHDCDPPPWWHFKRKTHLYIDGFAPKNARALMQFLLIPRNGPEQFHAWEPDYRDIFAWLETIEPPKYPWAIDGELAHRGERVFVRRCAKCHGTYGPEGKYPERLVPIEVVGTDRVRLDSLSAAGRAAYGRSWFAATAAAPTVSDPGGYVAPPLDGIWATAPYLHNGSVPTLWHLFHADARPAVWQRTEDGYDPQRVGLEITSYDELPSTAADPRQRRRYFDTRIPGKSAGGHAFPESLTEDEKGAVMEYLKTL